jgi:hypothetical protein
MIAIRGKTDDSREEATMDREHPVRDEPVADLADEEGGDPVCWAHLVCLECGAVTTEGHRPGCQSARDRSG